MKTHLVVLNNGSEPASRQLGALYNWLRHDCYWNKDYTAFRAIPLLWWDDASYIEYQARDQYPGPVEETLDTVEGCSMADQRCDDGVPF